MPEPEAKFRRIDMDITFRVGEGNDSHNIIYAEYAAGGHVIWTEAYQLGVWRRTFLRSESFSQAI